MILLAFAASLNSFAVADAENISLWENSGEQSAVKTSGTVGSLSDNLVIVEEEIDLTGGGSQTSKETEREAEFEIEIEPVPETGTPTGESGARPGSGSGTGIPTGESEARPGSGSGTGTPTGESEAKPGNGSEMGTPTGESEAKPGSGSGTESAGEISEIGSEIETEAGAETEMSEAETEFETETETETETESETETETETETESETETETETEEISAEPIEELRELLEQTVQDGKSSSAIAQYLGLEELKKAISEKGLTFEFRMEPGKGILQESGLSDWIRENCYYKWKAQIDPAGKQWMLDTGFGLMDQDVFSSTLYGNKEMLTLSVPQLYEKPLGIRSGNLYEQLKSSWAADAAEKIPSDERDFELNFFPDEETLEMWKDELRELYGYEEDTEKQYEELLNTFLDELTCTKGEEGDETVYSIEMEMDAARELYLGWFDLYYGPLKTFGKVTEYEFDQVKTDLEEEFDEFEKVVPENPSVKCYVEDNRLDRITGTIFVDMSGAEGQFVNIDDSSETEVLRKKSLEFEIIFWEETAGVMSTDVNFYVRDEEQEDFYYCNLFSGRFDSATGHCDLTFSLTDQETGAETAVQVGSRFTDVIPGESFVWDIDRITLEQDGDSTELLKGQICVQARPEDPEQPEDPVMLFDLSEEELQQVGGTISQNLKDLFGIESEEETEEEKVDELADESSEAVETTEETTGTESESEAKIVIFK